MDLLTLFSPAPLLGAHASLLLGACVLLLAPLFVPFSAAALRATALLAIAISACMFAIVKAPEGAGGFFGLYSHDYISYFAALLILLCGGLFVLLRRAEFLTGEFLALLLFLLLCLIFMISSDNLIMIFISLEGSSLALYALIAHHRSAVNAALGYFNYGMIGSAFFAMASALYYYQTGSMYLGIAVPNAYAGAISVMFLCVVAYKLSIAPFHGWLDEVYYRSEGAMAGFVSVVPKIAMAVVAYKLTALGDLFGSFALGIASAAMIFAAIRSLQATNARKMLVYSSVSHSSFALAAAALCTPGEMLYYFAVFAAVNMALFALLEAAKNADYSALAERASKQPVVVGVAVLLLLDLAALPPFGVFFAKVSVINAALAHSAIASICMALASLIMLLAYLRFIAAFFAKGQNFRKIADIEKLPLRSPDVWHFDLSARTGLAIAAAAAVLAALLADSIFSQL